MNNVNEPLPAGATDAQRRRLELARKAFRDFSAQCFWSAPADLDVTEADIPFIIRGLRLHGGHKGYKIVDKLCR